MLSTMRVVASASTTASSAVGERARVGRRLAALEDVVDQVLLQLRRRQLGGDGHEHQAAHDRGRGAVRPQHLAQAGRGSPSAECSAGTTRRRSAAAAPHFGQCVASVAASASTSSSPRGAQVFEVPGDAVEPIGVGVRVAGQVDPVVVDVGLQEAGADGALRAKLGDLGHRHVGGDGRGVAVGRASSETAATFSRLATTQWRRGWPERERSVVVASRTGRR